MDDKKVGGLFRPDLPVDAHERVIALLLAFEPLGNEIAVVRVWGF